MAASSDSWQSAGHKAALAGDYGAAVKHYKRALDALEQGASEAEGGKAADEVADLYSHLSTALLRLGHFTEALTAADRCVAAKPSWGKAHLGRAKALLAMKEYTAADSAYSIALALSPGGLDSFQARALRTAAEEDPRHARDQQTDNARVPFLKPSMQRVPSVSRVARAPCNGGITADIQDHHLEILIPKDETRAVQLRKIVPVAVLFGIVVPSVAILSMVSGPGIQDHDFRKRFVGICAVVAIAGMAVFTVTFGLLFPAIRGCEARRLYFGIMRFDGFVETKSVLGETKDVHEVCLRKSGRQIVLKGKKDIAIDYCAAVTEDLKQVGQQISTFLGVPFTSAFR